MSAKARATASSSVSARPSLQALWKSCSPMLASRPARACSKVRLEGLVVEPQPLAQGARGGQHVCGALGARAPGGADGGGQHQRLGDRLAVLRVIDVAQALVGVGGRGGELALVQQREPGVDPRRAQRVAVRAPTERFDRLLGVARRGREVAADHEQVREVGQRHPGAPGMHDPGAMGRVERAGDLRDQARG